MSLVELIIELMFDFAAIVLGLILIVTTQTNNNQHRFYWGAISISIGFFLAWENTTWIFTVIHSPIYEYQDILNIEKMLKWFAPASIISLFPLASLRPGYLNIKRVIVYMLPFAIILTITICYLSSNGSITKIASMDQILSNIDKFDIKLRLLIFISSILIPLLYFVYPVLNKKTYRRISPKMFLFLGFNFLLLGIYTLFTLFINSFIFNGFGITSVIFAIIFSILYLRSENPLSIHTGYINNETSHANKVSPIFFEIEKFMKEKHPFIDSNYNFKDLADTFCVKEQVIAQAIKSAGFTGFREYLNYQRLKHFKVIASQNSQISIKELMFACGFSSRSTFYRVFSEQYGISPVKYLNNLNTKETKDQSQ
jgi:AraC-like DNA-binding protein